MVKGTQVTRPIFSVILPTHNRADLIRYSIESVLWQTERNLELLIVGDGCTDNTAKVVSTYLADSRIQWFDLPKAPGFGYANRNKIFKGARGKYIAFIAHDDILFPDHLALLRKPLDTNKEIDVVYSRPLWVNRAGRIMPSAFNFNHKETLRTFMNVNNYIPASCFVHRKSCFKKVGYLDDSLPEAADWDLVKRILRSGGEKNFAFEPSPTTLHFLANWRSPKTALTWPHEISASFARHNKLYPKELYINIPKGQTEQSIFWEKISTNPHWVDEVRKHTLAVHDIMNHLQVPRIPRLEEELLEARHSVDSTLAKLKRSENELISQREEINLIVNSLTFRLKQKVINIIKPGSLLHRLTKRLAYFWVK